MRGRIQIIEALRGVAALQVLGAHMLPGVFGRAWGVDLFFLISGYVMVMASEGQTPASFFGRRLLRIVPLYWTATLAVFALSVAVPNLLAATRPDVIELIKSLLFIPFQKSNGLVQPVLFVGWTLNYEMFFYSLFALAMFLPRAAVVPAVVSGLCGLMLAGAVLHPTGVLGQFYTSWRLVEFAMGAVLGLSLRIPHHHFRALVPLAIAGEASYALYLAHPFVIALGRHLLGETVLAGALVVISAVALALVLTRGFDVPVRRLIVRTVAA